MNLKKDIPALVIYALIGIVLAGLVNTVQAFTTQMLDQSMVRIFVSNNQQAHKVAEQIKNVDGIVKVQIVKQDQAAAEFEGALGYPWPGADPLPAYLDVVVEPAQAAAVIDSLEAVSGIEYLAYHQEKMEQLAGLVMILHRAHGLLLLLALVPAVGLIQKLGTVWRRTSLKPAVHCGLLVVILAGLLAPQVVQAQTPTELRQVYREAEAALEELHKDSDKLEKDAADLEKKVESGEKNYAQKQSELKQTQSALSQFQDQISRLQSQFESVKQEEQGEARHYQQTVSRLQEAVNLAVQGMVEHEPKASLFLDYLLHTSGNAYAKASTSLASSQDRQQELAQKLVELEKEQQQLDQQLSELKYDRDQIGRELTQNRQQLSQVRQELAAVQRMIYTQESRVWHAKRDLRETLGFTDFAWPLAVKGVVSSDYGLRLHPIFDEERFHTGIDFACETGVPIKAAAAGKVVLSEDYNGYGLAVVIDHGSGVSTLYGHASKLLVKAGEEVQAGETIALVGSTGISTGPHLHFEVRQDQKHVDPWIWLG
ncbi:MAG TPA: peptidoglycan DD-metalloendopeptidase family protein [Firmicutes bacterium]|nr:peptidoglycan DD-metalloendopeptidase family protein [Bacillota bacterium]